VNNTDNFDNEPPASSVKTTTTTTITTSGGGTTTIIAGVDTPTPESKALQEQLKATSSQIDKINRQLAPAAFGGTPNLTADQRATLEAQRAELYDQYHAQTDAVASQTLPGTPTVITTPNTTTTTTTTKFSSSSSASPVGADDTQLGQEQIYSTSAPPPINQTKSSAKVANYLALYNEATATWQVIDANTGTIIADNLPSQDAANQVAGLQGAPGSTTKIDTSAANVANYRALYNEATATWQVLDGNTGAIIADNLPDEATANEVLGLQQSAVSSTPRPQPQVTGEDPYVTLAKAYDEEGNLYPGWTLDENNNPVFVGGDFVEPATLASAEQSRIAAQTRIAQGQNQLSKVASQQNNLDWRVRLSLADNADYLYAAQGTDPQGQPMSGILAPLALTKGVIFPYTPTITTNYKANYNNYDLTHSNYRGYYYQNSYADTLTVTGTFTAQTSDEANYLLAVIHFFRSVTKMFYGQSAHVGSPPPVCFLNGFGQYQFNKHPVLVTNFAYTLPADVDYIRAGSSNNLQLNQTQLRSQTNTINPSLSSVQRLASSFLTKGANPMAPAPTQPTKSNASTANNNPTYVPTKMSVVVSLLPVQSRRRVSQEFNLQAFANGNQLKGGFW
jgi:hypothetical protein